MIRPYRIGTRGSKLALWQANYVQEKLHAQSIDTEIVIIASEGDQNTTAPLQRLGSVGLFTHTLDKALLTNEIDLAVHSLKDYPTTTPAGLLLASVPQRHSPFDVLIANHTQEQNFNKAHTIGTGSIRRRAQWLHRYPQAQTQNLRGNLQTRLQRLQQSNWAGALFAAAGLSRLNIKPKNATQLDWMIPAPAQGALGVVCRQNQTELIAALQKTEDTIARLCTDIERTFLNQLEGGCSAPIGALCQPMGNDLVFNGILLSLNGQQTQTITEVLPPALQMPNTGRQLATKCLTTIGKQIISEIRHAKN